MNETMWELRAYYGRDYIPELSELALSAESARARAAEIAVELERRYRSSFDSDFCGITQKFRVELERRYRSSFDGDLGVDEPVELEPVANEERAA